MYKFYIVPDATIFDSHSELYSHMELFYDPYAESDAYAVIDPKNKDELNKSGSLEFTILPANIHYNDFYKKKTMVIVFDEGTWLYEGVVTDAPVDFYKQRKVTCAGPLTFLCDSVQAPDEKNEIKVPTSPVGTTYAAVPDTWLAGANPKSLNWAVQDIESSGRIVYKKTNDTSPVNGTQYYYPIASDGQNYSGATTTKSAGTKETIIAHITRLLDVHNSQVDPFKRIYAGAMYNTSDNTEHEFKSSGYRNTWDALKSDILDDYGKYFTITRGNDNNLYLNYLELAQLPSSSVPLIEFANNMMEMNESDESDDDVFTVLVPIGKDNLTIKDVTGHDSPEHSNREVSPYIRSWGGNKRYVVVGPGAVKRYGYIIKTQNFSDVDNKDTLWTRAVQYIHNNYDYHQEYEVKAIDLRFINGSGHRICVGDKCRIHSKWHGVDTSELYVISAEHDLANPENDTYRLGIPTSDREANNRTLTGQSQDAKSKNAANQASTSSGMSRLSSILEDYIHVTEWGLEMNSRLKNEVESNDGKYMTRFLQDEEHINLAAQKLFGIDGEGYGDTDAGYDRVPASQLKNSRGDYKNPHEEHWFEKVDGKYKLSDDLVVDPSKTYYYQRLWTRYSNLDVGPGGIKATVDGNYERSTYCSSWIDVNEEAILALTGHIHVDENGQVIIDSGAGFRTSHSKDTYDYKTFVQVPRTNYNESPKTKHWYERKLDTAGHWEGLNKSDQTTNSDYYTPSNDDVADRSKYYYVYTDKKETFTADYGVYDENNLKAGILTRLINHPTYQKVSITEVNNLKVRGGSPKAQGWYEYNSTNGDYGLTLDEEVSSITKEYFTVTNTSQGYSEIRGEHVVIGATDGYDGLDEATKARVNQYINDHNLDGTITEIASDVVVVNTLIAKYIEADEITAGTSLSTDILSFNEGYGIDLTFLPDSGPEDTGTYIDYDHIDVHYIDCGAILLSSDSGEDVILGTSNTSLGSANADPGDIVVGFGTITTSGDTVTIPYLTAGDSGEYDDDHVITFDKPASLGSVTWSSGNNTLTVKTVGGKDFLVGEVKNYVPSGQSEAMAMNNAGYLATETTGYSQVYGLYYTKKDVNGNDLAQKCMLFKTPKNRYPDAVSTIKTWSDSAKTDGEKIELGFGGSAKVYARYKTEGQYDDTDNPNNYTDKSGITVTAPEKPSANGATEAVLSNVTYNDGDTINLGYSGSVKVYGKFKLSDANTYTNCTGITVTAPANNATSHSIDIPNSGFDVDASEPSGTLLTNLRNAINEAKRDGKWLYFTVNCGDASKKYKMDFT